MSYRKIYLVSRWCFLVACLSLSAAADPLPASTQTPPPTAQTPELLTSASRAPISTVRADEFPGNTTIITAEEIAQSGVISLPDLLNRYEGITVLDTLGFGLGADGSVNLRGVVNSSRTGALVLLDGVRLNRVTGDEVHWQSIPLDQIQRIEIIRGGGGLAYGEGALSGVINITTKKDVNRPFTTEATLDVGSYGFLKDSVSGRGRVNQVSYGSSFTRQQLAGYRDASPSRTSTTTSYVGLDPDPGLHLETNILVSDDTSSFSGGLTPDASQQRRRQPGALPGFFDDHTTQVSLDSHALGPWGLSVASSSFWRERETDSVTSNSRFATIAPSQGATIRASQELESSGVRHNLVGALDLLDEKASTGMRGGTYSESNKQGFGLLIEETLRLADRVTVLGGLRYDRSRFEEDIQFPSFVGTLRFHGLSPQAGITVDVFHPVALYASYARPFKAPNVDDFSASVPSPYVGNIDLKPQQGDTYEVGVRAKNPKLGSIKSALFFNRIDQEILFDATTFQNQNMDTRRMGLELAAEPPTIIPHLTGQITYTYSEAEFRKGAFKGHAIPGVPEHRVTANATYEALPHLFLSFDWLLVQDFFRINDFTNQLRGDNYGVLNLGARVVQPHYTVHTRIENVTNEEYTTFQSSNGSIVSTGENPAPPIGFYGGVTVNF